MQRKEEVWNEIFKSLWGLSHTRLIPILFQNVTIIIMISRKYSLQYNLSGTYKLSNGSYNAFLYDHSNSSDGAPIVFLFPIWEKFSSYQIKRSTGYRVFSWITESICRLPCPLAYAFVCYLSSHLISILSFSFLIFFSFFTFFCLLYLPIE